MSAIPVTPFRSTYKLSSVWRPCEVVGVDVPDVWSEGFFIVISEDDEGLQYVHAVSEIGPRESK